MRRAIALLAALAALLLAGPAFARAPGNARVEITITDAGAQVTVALDRAVTRFRFADADTVREGDFHIATPGLALAGDIVSARKAFRKFAFMVTPFAEEHDAKYPAFYRLGAGALVYGPALLGHGEDWRTELVFAPKAGQALLPEGDYQHGFVFVGPEAMVVRDKGARFVFDPATPEWLRAELRHTVDGAVEAYGEMLGLPLEHLPLVAVRHFDADANSFVGDVSANAVTALRFHGGDWSAPNDASIARIRRFVLHEAFHFWNGGLAHHDSDAPAWLHEGGAEYASIVMPRLLGWSGDEAVEADLTTDLGRCREQLARRGDVALNSLDFLPAEIRYSCGPLLQWMVDLHMRGQAGGKTVMDAWRTVLAGAVAGDGSYSIGSFAKAAGVRKLTDIPAVALLVEKSGPERWDRLNGLLNKMGAKVEMGSTGTERSITLMLHLLRSSCTALNEGQRFGFDMNDGRFTLESPPGCGILAGNPVVTGFEGEQSELLSEAAYGAIAAKCAAGERVSVDMPGGREIAAPCNAGLTEPEQQIVVKRWRPAGGT